ncbi:hypothetical protein CRUP_038881 [Coryphaenoides rupestris]|nr:hypothetical protein CRUP_038881 [Coryphaenoides rupestris]
MWLPAPAGLELRVPPGVLLPPAAALLQELHILFSLLVFLVILLAIGLLYGAIYSHVHKNAHLGSQRIGRRSLGLLKTVVSIVGVFLLCWGPLFLLLLVDFFCVSRQCAPLFSADWVICLAVLNSALKPRHLRPVGAAS